MIDYLMDRNVNAQQKTEATHLWKKKFKKKIKNIQMQEQEHKHVIDTEEILRFFKFLY